MSFENPLDKIRKIKEENLEKKVAEKESIKLEEEKHQAVVDESYKTLKDTKEETSKGVEGFKNRISEITGNQEEMIELYHQTIAEAKEDPETLEYIRENFDEIFGEFRKQWKETISEKVGIKESISTEEERLEKIEGQLKEGFSETTEGKDEKKEEKKKELLQKYYRLINGGKLFDKTPEEILEKLSTEEFETLLNIYGELKEIDCINYDDNDFNLSDDIWEEEFNSRRLISFQEKNGEQVETSKKELEKFYDKLISELPEKPGELKEDMPEFENLLINYLSHDYASVDIKEQKDETGNLISELTDKISHVRSKIRDIENSLFKRNLKKRIKDEEILKGDETIAREYNNNLFNLSSKLNKKLHEEYRKMNIFTDLGLSYKKETEEDETIEEIFNILQKKNPITDEQEKNILRREELKKSFNDFKERVSN